MTWVLMLTYQPKFLPRVYIIAGRSLFVFGVGMTILAQFFDHDSAYDVINVASKPLKVVLFPLCIFAIGNQIADRELA